MFRGVWGIGTRVVVKQLLTSNTNMPPQMMKSFLNEANLWFSLRHPHIISMLGACHTSRPPFMICEEAGNGNLSYFLHDPTNAPRTWKLLHQAALGLEYLHRSRIVHGDLKCNNILVANDGSVKFADFGFAYVRSYSMSLQSKDDDCTSGRSGACRWRAPECFGGNPPSLKSDVFSFCYVHSGGSHARSAVGMISE